MKTNIRAVLIHGCTHSEETAGMGASHDVSCFARLLVPEGEFVCASYWLVGHSSLEGLEVNKLVSYYHWHDKEGQVVIVDKSFNDGASNAREGGGEDDGDGNSRCGFGGNSSRRRRRRKGLVWKRRIRAAMAMKAAAMAIAIAMASENLAGKIFSSYFFLARLHFRPSMALWSPLVKLLAL